MHCCNLYLTERKVKTKRMQGLLWECRETLCRNLVCLITVTELRHHLYTSVTTFQPTVFKPQIFHLYNKHLLFSDFNSTFQRYPTCVGQLKVLKTQTSFNWTFKTVIQVTLEDNLARLNAPASQLCPRSYLLASSHFFNSFAHLQCIFLHLSSPTIYSLHCFSAQSSRTNLAPVLTSSSSLTLATYISFSLFFLKHQAFLWLYQRSHFYITDIHDIFSDATDNPFRNCFLKALW